MDLAEQHYWRVLEYDQDNPVTLLYLSGLALESKKWSTFEGQINQGWETAKPHSALRVGYLLGQLVLFQQNDDAEMEATVKKQLEELSVSLEEDSSVQFLEFLNQRLFSI